MQELLLLLCAAKIISGRVCPVRIVLLGRYARRWPWPCCAMVRAAVHKVSALPSALWIGCRATCTTDLTACMATRLTPPCS